MTKGERGKAMIRGGNSRKREEIEERKARKTSWKERTLFSVSAFFRFSPFFLLLNSSFHTDSS